MSDFFHGVETIDVTVGNRTVRQVASAIIGLIGTAPTGDTNKITICLNDKDDAQFGAPSGDHSIPHALKTLREQGAGMVYVINVGAVGAISDLVGSVDEHGNRSGIKLMQEGYGTFGADAKILIAPNFSSHPAVAAALEIMADQIKAVCYVDLPLGLSPSEAVAARGGVTPLGLTLHQSASTRTRLCYPHRLVYDAQTGTRLEPSSTAWAGIRARVDREIGWWTSSSNKPIRGTLGLERTLTARIDDKDSEVNMLGAAGISTIFKDFGTGYNTWGNRTAAYPTDTSFENFEQVQRTNDMLEESLVRSSLAFVDLDIDQGVIDTIVNTGNGFLNSLASRRPQAIIGGLMWFDPAINPVSDITAAILRISYKYTPKFPNEHLIYEREVTGEFYLNLRQTQQTL